MGKTLKPIETQSTQEQVLIQISSLALSFATHVSGEKHVEEMVDAMYKILVTGNGAPPLPEVVRGHTTWIAERDQERCEDKADQKEADLQNKKDVREDRRDAVVTRRQWLIMLATELIGFIIVGVMVALHWK